MADIIITSKFLMDKQMKTTSLPKDDCFRNLFTRFVCDMNYNKFILRLNLLATFRYICRFQNNFIIIIINFFRNLLFPHSINMENIYTAGLSRRAGYATAHARSWQLGTTLKIVANFIYFADRISYAINVLIHPFLLSYKVF